MSSPEPKCENDYAFRQNVRLAVAWASLVVVLLLAAWIWPPLRVSIAFGDRQVEISCNGKPLYQFARPSDGPVAFTLEYHAGDERRVVQTADMNGKHVEDLLIPSLSFTYAF